MADQKKTTSKKKTPVTKLRSESGLSASRQGTKIPVSNLQGKIQTDAVFPKQLQREVNAKLVAQAYRVYRINNRAGTQSTKTRGEVKGSTRKIFRQKGTGRARHGSIRAPIFVGGGIALGPRPRVFEAKMPQKMKRDVFWGMMSEKVREKKLIVISGGTKMNGKTKEVEGLLRKLNINDKKVVILVEPDMKKLIRAGRNLPNVTIKSRNNLSGIDLLLNEFLLVTKESFDKLIEKMPIAN